MCFVNLECPHLLLSVGYMCDGEYNTVQDNIKGGIYPVC